MNDLLVRPIHSPEFLQKHKLGVEAHLGRYDKRDNWAQYVPFVRGVHLPYANLKWDGKVQSRKHLNMAAIDDEYREYSIACMKDAVSEASKYPVDRVVSHSIGVEYFENTVVGDYSRLVDAFVQLAKHAAQYNITICIENNLRYFDGFQYNGEDNYFRNWADSRESWYKLYLDINLENVKLNLDTSHAANNVMLLATREERTRALWEFLDDRDAIGRAHWSDSIISTTEGKADQHLVPGKGDIPEDFHQAIKTLNVPKLLEQNCTEDEVTEGLEFIAKL